MQAQIMYSKSDMLTLAQVARKLGRSYEHVRRMVESGRLQAFQFGFSSTRYVPRSAVERMMQGVEV